MVKLLQVVRPQDFDNRWKGFLRWRDVTVSALQRNLAKNVADGWTGEPAAAKKLLAR